MRAIRCVIWMSLLGLVGVLPGTAQGIIIGPDARPAALTLRSHRVEATLQEHLAVVTVEHTFVNPGAVTVEGTFLFPLPPEAHVSRFSMTVNGQEMQGRRLVVNEARERKRR